MTLISKELAKEEFEKLKAKPSEELDDKERILINWLARELMFLDKIDISYEQFSGKYEDVEERISNSEVLILYKGEYDEMIEKCQAYDRLANFINQIIK